jgi:hypothetical protein
MQGFIQFSERFGNMLSRALLTFLYYVVMGPFAIFYQMSADPLHLRRQKNGNWTTWDRGSDTLDAARRQD